MGVLIRYEEDYMIVSAALFNALHRTMSGLSVDVSIVLFHVFVRGLETRQRSGSRCVLFLATYTWRDSTKSTLKCI